jgi:hypothetical protein
MKLTYQNQTSDRFRIVRGGDDSVLLSDSEWQQPPTHCGSGPAGETKAASLQALWNRIGPEQRAAASQTNFEELLAQCGD